MSSIFKAANTAVITGGASGIGLALAKKCAGYGMKVIAADWDTKCLSALPKGITPYQMDVSQAADWTGLRAKVEQDFHGRISLLALNAGVGGKSSWSTPEVFQRIFSTNVFGIVNGLSCLLPLVQENASASSPSAIVITGSKQGITNPPGNPAYNASKSAVKTMAEHLSWDLRDRPDISVHLLVPGWTFTGIAGGVAGAGRDDEAKLEKRKPEAAWWPEEVVEYLEKKMEEGQFWVLCPDNEVTEEMDKKRMLWTAGDAVNGRPPLSRWRNEYKDDVSTWMAK